MAKDHSNREMEKLAAETLRSVATQIKAAFPPGLGMALFVFDYGPKGDIAYVSTAERKYMVAAIREWLAHVED